MPNFIVTFRIHDDATYSDRYQSLVEEIYKVSGGPGKTSDETTSFFAFSATGWTAQSLCDHLYLHTKLTVPKDKLLVVDVLNRKKAQRGFTYPTVLDTALGF